MEQNLRATSFSSLGECWSLGRVASPRAALSLARLLLTSIHTEGGPLSVLPCSVTVAVPLILSIE